MGFSCNLFRKPIHWTWQSGQSLNPPHDHSWSPWPIWKHVETYHPNSYQWSSILIHNNSTWFWPFSLIKSHLKFSKSYKAPFKLNYIQTLYEIILNPCFHTHTHIYIYISYISDLKIFHPNRIPSHIVLTSRTFTSKRYLPPFNLDVATTSQSDRWPCVCKTKKATTELLMLKYFCHL